MMNKIQRAYRYHKWWKQFFIADIVITVSVITAFYFLAIYAVKFF